MKRRKRYNLVNTWSAVNLKKHLTSMSCKLEPAIWSRDTGQRIPCFDRCQLIITWMSNIKEVHSKPRLHVSVNLLEYGSHLAPLHRRRGRRRAYAPTSNTASHDNHKKKSTHGFPFVSNMSMGLRLAALRAAGAPLLGLLCFTLLERCVTSLMRRWTLFTYQLST